MFEIRGAVATVLLLACAGCESPSAAPRQAPPARLLVVSGDRQETTVGEQLPAVLVVRVENASGDPVPDQLLSFQVVTGRGTVRGGATLTDENGLAREQWTLGTIAGDTQRVVARLVDHSTGLASLSAAFVAVGKAAAPIALSPVDSSDRTGPAGLALADSIAVKVTDRFGNAVSGTPVEFRIIRGGGSVTPQTPITDLRGIARAEWTLGAHIDSTQAVEAAISNAAPVLVGARAVIPPNAVVTIAEGDSQSATVGMSLPASLVVSVALPDGRPLSGANVRWSTKSGAGSSVTPETLLTDEDGRAAARWTLGTVPGGYSATATIDGASAVTFGATAERDVPAAVVKFAGDRQTAVLGRELQEPLAARVTDRFGNPASGVLVRWAVTGQGGSVQPDSSLTDSEGVARTSWTLGTSPGEPSVNAIVDPLAPVPFNAAARVQPTALTFAVEPSLTEGTMAVSPASQVVVHDEYGNRDTTSTGLISVRLGTNSTGAQLFGVTSVKAVAGIATFDNLRIDRAGTYTLVVTADGLAADTSSAFRVGLTFTSIGAGENHTCATTVADATYCWGANGNGQLGDGSLSYSSTTPVPVAAAGVTFKHVYPATDHTCALTTDGIAYCWGIANRVGDGTYAGTRVPPAQVAAPLGTRFTSLAVGYRTCGVTTLGSAYCWNGDWPTIPKLVQMPPDARFHSLDVGGSGMACGLLTTGVLYCWSGLHYTPTPTVVATPPGVTFVELVVGYMHACGRTEAGVVYCWGSNRAGELGDGTTLEHWTPQPVAAPAGVAFAGITTGPGHVCGITPDGDVYCWGGAGTNSLIPKLQTAPPGKRYVEVSAGSRYACARTADGAAYCWGVNGAGRFGNGAVGGTSTVPLPVSR